jgi:hypothetical protein
MLTVSSRILISAPIESVRLYLQDLKNAAQYDPKVNSVSVIATQASGAEAEVSGCFLGFPWKGAFLVGFSADGGYRGEMTRGPLPRMVVLFHLHPVTGGTVLTREEYYQFSILARPFMLLFKRRLLRLVDRQLGVIKEEAERLNRKIQLQRIESVT